MKKIILILSFFTYMFCNYEYFIESHNEEIQMPECSNMDQLQCINDDSCYWINDLEIGDCSDITNSSECYQINQCLWYNAGNYGYLYDNCYGGTYEIDNSYCQENVMPECSIMSQSQCIGEDSCNWIENYEWSNCSNYDSATECSWANDNGGNCNWSWNSTQWQDTCSGGSFQLNTSYCQEIDYIIGDINSDFNINILDVIETINIILNNNYDVIVDLDNNEQVNVLDVIQLINIILND